LYLAAKGYGAQQTDGARDPDAPDDLWRPVDGDQGEHRARGAFDRSAIGWSPLLWTATNRAWIALGVAGAAALGALVIRSLRRT
jgi:hypothetical protein